MADELLRQGWTLEELVQAKGRICESPELAKEASYAGAITPAIFAAARPKPSHAGRWCSGCSATTYVNADGLCDGCREAAPDMAGD